MSIKNVVGITMGDPCGIGPEIILKALKSSYSNSLNEFLVIGSYYAMSTVNQNLSINMPVKKINQFDDFDPNETTMIQILDPENIDAEYIQPGVLSKEAGKACMEWVEIAAHLCLENKIQGMATAPVNKEAASLAGYVQIGHMELLQSITNSPEVATMLISKNLRVVHLTTHKPVQIACDFVTKENIYNMIKLTNTNFINWGFDNPRIGVAALNPHGSDGGLLGREENEEISPAIIQARQENINVEGPIPADIIFNQAIDNRFDAVICMYHDQGHIPVKVYGFEESITVNLGLPLIRTSVDHGTAFDIAWKGIADNTSMVEAIKLAQNLISGSNLGN
ncbi:MAG: 4-hydroxythreonine-4-phosphate dehydrogenase PdxA [Dehalococcoidia bacterium]|nr:4-hydroxythreonine-4-phosphate dehydrogenase PdxA [Dehalococcoidia bacterium]